MALGTIQQNLSSGNPSATVGHLNRMHFPEPIMRKTLVLLLAAAAFASAQSSSPPPRNPSRTSGPPSAMQPVVTNDMVGNLNKLDQVVENSRLDLARLRVEKWKTDNGTKRQAESNAESVNRNMAAALPQIVQQVRKDPNSLGASFKLYRNLNALYDVMSTLAETAGAFGTKDEYQALANDTANIDTLRRAMADQLEMMTLARDNELAQLRTRVQQAAAAAPAPPPKKVVIDDNEPEKKPAKKATTTKKKTTTASEGQATPPKP